VFFSSDVRYINVGGTLEVSAAESKYFDIMMYPVSPTSSFPATYPFLPPKKALYGENSGNWVYYVLTDIIMLINYFFTCGK
jgi:hypothetical protein